MASNYDSPIKNNTMRCESARRVVVVLGLGFPSQNLSQENNGKNQEADQPTHRPMNFSESLC